MNWKSFSFVFATVLGITLFSSVDGALNAYLRIKGQKQGFIQGGVTMKGREGSIAVMAMKHEIVSPRDAASGLATGKRQHKPLTVIVEWDRALPLLMQALTTNETLATVEIDFWGLGARVAAGSASPAVLHTKIKLTNAHISGIRTILPDTRDPVTARMNENAEISFVYQKIEMTHVPTGTAFSDSPSSVVEEPIAEWIGRLAGL
jgi:type VI secretion system secreted protein Hcp